MQINGSLVEVVREGRLVEVPWKDVQVGDVVKVSASRRGVPLPCSGRAYLVIKTVTN